MSNHEIIPDWRKGKALYENHHLLPRSTRMLICGSSGDGKSVLLLRMLLCSILDYDVIFLITPSVDQPEYQIFIEGLNAGLLPSHILGIFKEQDNIYNAMSAVKSIAERLKCKQQVAVITSKNVDAIDSPEELRMRANTCYRSLHPDADKNYVCKVLIILDDAMTFKQTKIDALFTFGRTFSENIVYLVQDYYGSSKRGCRSNVNAWILFRQSQDELRRIFNKIDKEKNNYESFVSLSSAAWAKNHGFLLITRDQGRTAYTDGEQLLNEIKNKSNKLYPS